MADHGSSKHESHKCYFFGLPKKSFKFPWPPLAFPLFPLTLPERARAFFGLLSSSSVFDFEGAEAAFFIFGFFGGSSSSSSTDSYEE